MTTQRADEHWNEFYSGHDRVGPGRPTAVLVEETTGLAPGRALELGCGEGDDAIWLAGQGWTVTAVDVSTVALGRAAGHAATAGVTVDWRQHDLGQGFPEGEFDLVTVMFLHSRVELDREQVLRRAADAVAPGGVLLIEGHLGLLEDLGDLPPGFSLPTPDQVIAGLRLPDGQWEVQVSWEHDRAQVDLEGTVHQRRDGTVKLRRLA